MIVILWQVGGSSDYDMVPAMKQYFDTAKATVVHHGIKALKQTLACNKDCISFVVALENAMTLTPAMSAAPKEEERQK